MEETIEEKIKELAEEIGNAGDGLKDKLGANKAGIVLFVDQQDEGSRLNGAIFGSPKILVQGFEHVFEDPQLRASVMIALLMTISDEERKKFIILLENVHHG